MSSEASSSAISQGAINAAAGSAVLTSIFYTTTLIAQRVSGLVRIHSGTALPVTVLWGAASTGLCLAFTHYNAEIISQTISEAYRKDIPHGLRRIGIDINDYLPRNDRSSSSSSSSSSSGDVWAMLQNVNIDYSPSKRWWQSRHSTVQQDAKQLLLGLSVYALFERRSFRTALPSTLLSTGVFAHTPIHWHRKLPNVLAATSDVASSAQRRIIQQLGKIHGCHHCGSRQVTFPYLFHTPPTFIADHMPPTKIIKERNLAWYRQLTGILAKQQLLPQCQTCFSRQGNAVKAGFHVLAYHRSFRSWHFAPAVAYLLILSEQQALASSSTASEALLENITWLPVKFLRECSFFDLVNWLTCSPLVLETLEIIEPWIKMKG